MNDSSTEEDEPTERSSLIDHRPTTRRSRTMDNADADESQLVRQRNVDRTEAAATVGFAL